MEDEGLIEGRHFGNILPGRVDYSIENPGIKKIKGKELEKKRRDKS